MLSKFNGKENFEYTVISANAHWRQPEVLEISCKFLFLTGQISQFSGITGLYRI